MAVHELTLESIKNDLAGGRVGEAFALELKRCVTDCEDRPADSKGRKVTLEIELTPETDEKGFCEQVWGQIRVSSSVPKRKTKPISFGVRRGGMLVFNDLAEDDFRQKTIDE